MGDTSVEWHVGDTPHFSEPKLPSWAGTLACRACGSEDTETLHHAGGGSIIGTWSELEVRCRACGCYTAKVEDYES